MLWQRDAVLFCADNQALDGSSFPRLRGRSVMRVAAIYDIHGNLPALEAVLKEIRQAGVERVVGGDVVPGPMPRETLGCLLDLDIPVQFIGDNGESAVLAELAGRGAGG